MSELGDALSKPTAPAIPGRATNPEKDFTRSISVSRGTVEAEIRGEAGSVNEGTGLEYLKEEGLNPEEWVATHFRKIKYGQGMESVKFSYKRIGWIDPDRPNLDEIIERVEAAKPAAFDPDPDWVDGVPQGLIIALGDMQFGKIDGDGVEGTFNRVVRCLDAAENYAHGFDHIHIAWLGDHIEGFVSQGGANTWRTQLTLNEQIRLTRRVMHYALEKFARLAPRLTMAAVPGNHGEPQRFAGKGVTRYDDSHDTEALIAVSEAAQYNPAAYGHVEFYVPETDEMTVVLDVAGTVVAHAHGHQWRPVKHFEWWKGQAFNAQSAMHQADLMLAGHLHHFHVDTDGPRMFVQVPSLESESTWFKHSKGTPGDPGIVLLTTQGGRTDSLEVVRG